MVHPKRKTVPATLHSELSEYASLLRALRTNDTLDLASQLTRPASPTPSVSNEDGEAFAPASFDLPQPTSPTTRQHAKPALPDVATSAKSFGTQATTKRKRCTRDTWTRWPLMPNDVHVPEWGLEDELELIALRTLRDHRNTSSVPNGLSGASPESDADGPGQANDDGDGNGDAESVDDDGDDDDDDDEDVDEDEEDAALLQPVMPALVFAAQEQLSGLLGALAAHVPAVPAIMQDRIHPMGWETVLDVASACGLADATCVVDHLLSCACSRSFHPGCLRPFASECNLCKARCPSLQVSSVGSTPFHAELRA
jgi:hypothetical protein